MQISQISINMFCWAKNSKQTMNWSGWKSRGFWSEFYVLRLLGIFILNLASTKLRYCYRIKCHAFYVISYCQLSVRVRMHGLRLEIYVQYGALF